MRFSDAVAGLVAVVLLCAASSCVVDAVHNGEAVSTSVADAAQAIRALKLHATKHLAKHAAKRHAARALASYEAASKSMRALYDKAQSKLLEAASVSSGFALRARSTYICRNLVSKWNMCCCAEYEHVLYSVSGCCRCSFFDRYCMYLIYCRCALPAVT